MHINGKLSVLSNPMSVAEFLLERGYAPGAVAVDLNGEIVHQSEYKVKIINDDDAIEIFHAIGGGT